MWDAKCRIVGCDSATRHDHIACDRCSKMFLQIVNETGLSPRRDLSEIDRRVAAKLRR